MAQLAFLLCQSFSSGLFPSILETSKVISMCKKGSTLESSNYRPIVVLSSNDKIPEKIMYSKIYSFTHIHFNLVLDRNRQLFMILFI